MQFSIAMLVYQRVTVKKGENNGELWHMMVNYTSITVNYNRFINNYDMLWWIPLQNHCWLSHKKLGITEIIIIHEVGHPIIIYW